MVGNCIECRKCEENMYWSRFRTVQFCQFLSGRFKEHLAIPKKFTHSIKEKMSQTVTLRGPSGHIWNVGLVKNGDMLFFKLGWNAFVEDHFLQENDILIFKYNGNSRFDVSMFDQGSLCEKEACYFVKKCEHEAIGQGSKRRRSLQESSEDTNGSSDGAADCQLVEKINSGSTRKDPSKTKLVQSSPRGRRKTRKGRRGSGEANVFQLRSRRRKVTEEEIKRAAEMANASASANCFTVVMRQSHVYKGFFMSIPAEWAKANLPSRDHNVVLRIKDQKWLTKYHYKGYGGGLTGGWKNFVIDNFLEEFDVCLFERPSETDDAFILDVKIFRVVQEVIPPSRTRGGGGGETSREDMPRGALKQLGKSLRVSTDEEEDDEGDDEEED